MTSRRFVGRAAELEALEHWWESPFPDPALIWGRRRVGKTTLVEHFAVGRRTVFHTATRRPVADELAELSNRVAATVTIPGRDLRARPYERWEDLLDGLAGAARDEPLLLVLDEFPELIALSPALPGTLRAFLDRSRGKTLLRILICGSSVRTMEAVQGDRQPLHGRIGLALPLRPFRPHEVAAMLPDLRPAERALAYGVVGGTPQYLDWWDQDTSVIENLRRLACRPGSPLLAEGDRIVACEADPGSLPAGVLFAIASGRTKHQEITDAVNAEPSRTLDRLVQTRLVERQVPVTEDPRRSRKRIYRIADNFLSFYLDVLERHRAEIERGLGYSVVGEIVSALDDRMGAVYEDAFREHLRRLAAAGRLALRRRGGPVVARRRPGPDRRGGRRTARRRGDAGHGGRVHVGPQGGRGAVLPHARLRGGRTARRPGRPRLRRLRPRLDRQRDPGDPHPHRRRRLRPGSHLTGGRTGRRGPAGPGVLRGRAG
nr:hypothetical protein GCM10020093_060560 [Planobispora longispora]